MGRPIALQPPPAGRLPISRPVRQSGVTVARITCLGAGRRSARNWAAAPPEDGGCGRPRARLHRSASQPTRPGAAACLCRRRTANALPRVRHSRARAGLVQPSAAERLIDARRRRRFLQPHRRRPPLPCYAKRSEPAGTAPGRRRSYETRGWRVPCLRPRRRSAAGLGCYWDSGTTRYWDSGKEWLSSAETKKVTRIDKIKQMRKRERNPV